MTIGDILAEQARTRPDAVAIIDARSGVERSLTFAELEREGARAAEWLEAYGLRKGSAVLVFVPMSAELYVALLAMFRLGVVALFLDPSAGRAHIEQCCARWPPDALLATPKAHWLRVVSKAVRRIPLKWVVGGGWVPGARRFGGWSRGASAPRRLRSPEPVERAAVVPDNAAGAPHSHEEGAVSEGNAALVTFTSGSTGVPKAAVRTHGFLVAQHRVLAPGIALEAGEVDLATLPVFTLANLASGVTTLIPDVDLQRPGSVEAARIVRQIEHFGVSRITASPAFFERLIEHGRAAAGTLGGLRKLHTGGAPVFARVLDALQELAPNAHVVGVYGSTEAEPIAHIAVEEINAQDRAAMRFGRGLLAGPPIADISLRILRDRWGAPRGALTMRELERETLTTDEPGEIVVSGLHVLKGYLGGVGDGETKFPVDGEVWHRTGDAGLLDEHGRLWLLGRCAARIDDARGRLYPFAVECVAMTFCEVRRAAMLGHAGKRLLFIEATAPGEALATKLRAAAAWSRIDEVRFVASIPVDRRHNAKIDYPALRRMAGVEKRES